MLKNRKFPKWLKNTESCDIFIICQILLFKVSGSPLMEDFKGEKGEFIFIQNYTYYICLKLPKYSRVFNVGLSGFQGGNLWIHIKMN